MLRKVHTSCSRRKFLHEQPPANEFQSNNNITRPPTSHPYSAMRNLRSQQTLAHNYAYINKSHEQHEQNREGKNANGIGLVYKFKDGLPKLYAHILTEIRMLFRYRNGEDQKTIDSLLGSLSRKITGLHDENQERKKAALESQRQYAHLQQQHQELSKKLRKHESGMSQGNSSSMKNVGRKNQYELVLQNVKLGQLNAVYLNRMTDLQQGRRDKHVQIKKEVQQNESTEILRFHNRVSYLEMKLKNSEEKEVKLNAQLKELGRRMEELNEKVDSLEAEKTKVEERLGEWRERAQMQLQDSEMHLTRQNYLLFSIKKLREINKSLTEKLINQGGEGLELKQEIEPNPYFQYQIDFFKSMRATFFDTRYKQFKLNINSRKNENIEMGSFELQQEYLAYRKHEEVNLSQFAYYMPSFYSFIEETSTAEIASTRAKGNASVSRIFIQILRAILNSKLNEFLMMGEERYSRFPQFVYTWFQRFYFNSEKCDVAALQPYMQKPFPQDLFYRDLMNIKLDQSWEIITFRQFLLQELNLQELYFYLMCQNLLFRRGSVSREKQYQGDFSVLVEYNAAKSVLDMVLSDFQSWNLSYLTSKMREKMVYRKNVEFIEAGFFLRCLVQYYKIQRINRYKYIAKLCDEFKSEEKGLRFSSFISVVNRFTEVGIDQKMRLYRECYCLGKGKITADIIFTVCTQKLVFLKYLKLKCFYKVPLLTTQRSIHAMQMSLASKKGSQVAIAQKKPIICLQPSDPYLYMIYTRMIALLRADGSVFCQQIERLGMLELLAQLTQMQKIFTDKVTNTDSSLLRCKHFMHFLSDLLAKVRIVNFASFYELLNEQNKKKNCETFWIDVDQAELSEVLSQEFRTTLSIYDKLTRYVGWKEKVYDFRLHHAARKIQRMVRKKFIAPFIELYKIIYSQFKDGEQPLGKR